MSVNLNCMLLILHISGIMPTTKAFLQSDPSDWGIIRAQSTVHTTNMSSGGFRTDWMQYLVKVSLLWFTAGFLGEPKHWVFIHNLILWDRWRTSWREGNEAPFWTVSEELFWGIVKLLRNHSGLYEARAVCGSVLFINRDIKTAVHYREDKLSPTAVKHPPLENSSSTRWCSPGEPRCWHRHGHVESGLCF